MDSKTTKRFLFGIDPDIRKIKNAKRLDAKAVEFVSEEIRAMPTQSFDCITIMDVMCLLPVERWSDFLCPL